MLAHNTELVAIPVDEYTLVYGNLLHHQLHPVANVNS